MIMKEFLIDLSKAIMLRVMSQPAHYLEVKKRNSKMEK